MYGIYISAVGVAIVFVSLLTIAIASEAVLRLFRGKVPMKHARDLLKVAALAATCYCVGAEIPRPSKPVASETTINWSVAARIEALNKGVERIG